MRKAHTIIFNFTFSIFHLRSISCAINPNLAFSGGSELAGCQARQLLELAAEMGHIPVSQLLRQILHRLLRIGQTVFGSIDPGMDQIIHRRNAEDRPVQRMETGRA